MKYIIGMTTINRNPSDNYLEKTIDSFDRAGGLSYPNSKLVISDSGSKDLSFILPIEDKYNGKLDILYSDHKLTSHQNVSKVLKHCANISSKYVIYIQDDIVFRPDIMSHINSFVEDYPDSPMWCFYTPYQEVLTRANKGIKKWDYKPANYYGSLCYCLRKEHAMEYAQELISTPSGGGDIVLNRWLQNKFPNKFIAASCPCFVQHIGKHSIIHGKNMTFRRNQSFDKFFGKGA